MGEIPQIYEKNSKIYKQGVDSFKENKILQCFI